MRNVVIDPMDTTEFRVEHALNNLMDAAREINDLRRSNEARSILMRSRSREDLEMTRDQLSRVLDDIRSLS